MVKWEKEPYKEKTLAGRVYPMSTMGTMTFDNGETATLAWVPRPFSLVLDVPHKRATYRLDLQDVLVDLEMDIVSEVE